jgi:hypothetical protein
VAEAICFLGGSTIILHIICVDLTAEGRVRSRASPSEICSGQSGIKTGIFFPNIAPHLHLSEGQAGEASEASNKAVIFQTSGSFGEKAL